MPWLPLGREWMKGKSSSKQAGKLDLAAEGGVRAQKQRCFYYRTEVERGNLNSCSQL